ncbi:MAG: SDR family NAD(P)-dependent oxidoreductase [Sagittula sp.]|uniref:SDR family NAD(P)-dependent oxidoreductase n=1 Tax=Sagittula sp. TaxID=2038081 RepID=UPI0040593002
MSDDAQPGLPGLTGGLYAVLGGGQGIGAEMCGVLAASGARVICCDLDLARAEAVANELSGAVAQRLDVTDADAMAAFFAGIAEAHGQPLSGLVDIVGVADLRRIEAFSPEDYDWQQNIVLRQAFLAVKHGAEAMKDSGGAIVLVSSIASLASAPNQGVYGIAKAGLNHLTRVAAHEYGPRNIRVNAVAPGLTRTPRVVAGFGEALLAEIEATIPLRRANQPRDIATAAAFLLSDLSCCISGVVLPVDGGLSALSAVPEIDVGARLKALSEGDN